MAEGATIGSKARALVICTHLRPSRDKRRSSYLMQPISGLHVASLLDRDRFQVELYHEDWHGPFDPERATGYDLVFLSGLQVDFDRMRQLSFYFRRSGAKTVAGGSIATSFPEFASRFFDAVCAGGADSTREVAEDFLMGALKPIYRSRMTSISRYVADYGLMTEAGITPPFHLIEATRGCSFKCSFCVMPSEVGGHATFDLADVKASIDRAIEASPPFSFQRLSPMILFLDNNLSDDRDFLMQMCAMLKADRRIRGWAALVTQNVVNDRALVRHLADSKCIGLFAGIESLDPVMLKKFRKTQNLSRRSNILDDVAYAESRGIGIAYGLLFDPQTQTAAEMRRQLAAITEDPLMPMPVYMSFIAPLAGTQSFWEDLEQGRLAPGLRLRDLDGETICYRHLADSHDNLAQFGEQVFRRPWEVIGRWDILAKTVRRIVRARLWSPIRWGVMASANLHCYLWSKGTPDARRSYKAGHDVLDPQYAEIPADISEADRQLYFEPVELVDTAGEPAEWLRDRMPLRQASGRRSATVRAPAG
ncbi:B12-binding domain-containing radical SAM protein [Sandaracinobacteroides hominis]|uniref:B12-binding domain-containing radical SAM protein n=1 Tax=Sandaracinobacteroides hominis TaxID=2780086 RepID=UPI0018F5F85D|nr:hypothetical protein [Sandaracinobacteroides hominis]